MLHFDHQAAWAQWLAAHHARDEGVWLRHAKKGAPQDSVSHPEALEVALCFGWIDGQRKSLDEHYWLQRWVPRGAKSIWSKINRDKALRYIEEGKMQPSGLKEIERARADGRWDAAYDSASTVGDSRRFAGRVRRPSGRRRILRHASARRTATPCCSASRPRRSRRRARRKSNSTPRCWRAARPCIRSAPKKLRSQAPVFPESGCAG